MACDAQLASVDIFTGDMCGGIFLWQKCSGSFEALFGGGIFRSGGNFFTDKCPVDMFEQLSGVRVLLITMLDYFTSFSVPVMIWLSGLTHTDRQFLTGHGISSASSVNNICSVPINEFTL